MIETNLLNAGYGKIHVLYDVNFIANPEEITVIVGPNGSGKSTLLKTIMGLTDIYSGHVKFKDREITSIPAHKRARMGITYLPQLESVFTNLTVKENLVMAGYLINKKEEFEERLEMVLDIFPRLKDYMPRKARTLSGGERQMLAMAMALIMEPKVIMFDEPTASLAPKVAFGVIQKIIELKERLGLTIIVVEQSAKKALKIGDRAYLLVSGRVMFEGDAKELLAHPELGKLYLGIVS
ncbi:MAG TPA: ABC transporter ATP-binding protein [Candidatus Korarchaeota archaeon]|nr:ABC transporter ATP-binding protein [Candidatus Korarchaeota archaeon]